MCVAILGHIEFLVSAGVLLSELSKSLYRILLVVSEVFRQQQSMYDQSCHRILAFCYLS